MFLPDYWAKTKPRGKTYRLYPFESTKLVVTFVYGVDFERELNLFAGISKSTQMGAALVMLFVSIAGITLYFMRRTLGLPRSDIVSTYMDCWIPFFWGGNIQMRHKYERWFFCIMLFGAFFIMSVFAGQLLNSVLCVRNQKISTFEQLANIKSPITILPTLGIYSDIIHSMLRSVNLK